MKIRILITSIFVLIYFGLLAQKTKKVKDGTETYYVLQSDETIRHGEYKRAIYNFKVEGTYSNGAKIGDWIYSINNEIIHVYNWDTNKLVTGDNGPNRDGLTMPICLGGMSAFYSVVATIMMYPAAARQSGIEGKVYFEITIDEKGKMKDPIIISGIGFGCDKETLRVLNKIELDWIPAQNSEGRPISSKMKMPMYFKLAR